MGQNRILARYPQAAYGEARVKRGGRKKRKKREDQKKGAKTHEIAQLQPQQHSFAPVAY